MVNFSKSSWWWIMVDTGSYRWLVVINKGEPWWTMANDRALHGGYEHREGKPHAKCHGLDATAGFAPLIVPKHAPSLRGSRHVSFKWLYNEPMNQLASSIIQKRAWLKQSFPTGLRRNTHVVSSSNTRSHRPCLCLDWQFWYCNVCIHNLNIHQHGLLHPLSLLMPLSWFPSFLLIATSPTMSWWP